MASAPHAGPGGHAGQMDMVYRYQRHIYDLTRKYYLLGRDRMIRGLDAREGMRVLELGCGTGRNLVLAARRWPGAHFCGLDISAEMLRTAADSVGKAGLSERIALLAGDATDFADAGMFGEQRFDRIFMSYTLSMIPQWEMALEEAIDVLAPGGSIHIVDFGQQERLPGLFRDALFAWLRQFHVSPRGDLRGVLEDVAKEHGLALTFTPLYRGYAWQARLDRN